MENFSHTVAGLAAGELLQRSLRPEPTGEAQALRRRMLLAVGGVAANFPDLDLLLTPLLPAPLGYLLHHRGHTHTLLYALPQALALIALVWLLWPNARRLLHASATARLGLAASAAIGLLLHLLMDYLNSYGLHPFHPLDSRWLFGDMVFIVEPVFWIAFGVPLMLMTPRRWMRIALPLLFAGALAACTWLGFLHWASLAGLACGAALVGWAQQRAGSGGRQGLAAGMLFAATFTALQGWASGAGRERAAAHLQELGAARLLDVAMTPLPANPLCWSFVAVERDDGRATFRVRRGFLSLAPDLMPLSACPSAFLPPLASPPAAIALSWEAENALPDLRALAATCHVHAWMRFARAPFIADKVLDDARFSARSSFSSLDPDSLAARPCPTGVPQWDLPRQDLLDAARR